MTILVKPITACNLKCSYCFQNDQKTSGNYTNKKDYDMQAILGSMREMNSISGGLQVLHGGEILLMPIPDLEILLSESLRLNGFSAIQTNGVLIQPEHIELFEKYNTSISVSCDGPNRLNRARSNGSVSNTDKTTETIHENIAKMINRGIQVGVISVISKLHADKESRDMFHDWILKLDAMGVAGGRMNLLQSNEPLTQEMFQMTNAQAREFYCDTAQWLLDYPHLNWDPFREIVDNLLGLGNKNCVYEECDPLSTVSVLEILSNGEMANCSKLAFDGVPFLANDVQPVSSIRYEILSRIDQKNGGCMDCKYWSICHGHCPGDAVDGDWRRKTRFCETWYGLYDFYYRYLKALNSSLVLKVDKTDASNKTDTDQELASYMRKKIFAG